jgi:hypothetical protein
MTKLFTVCCLMHGDHPELAERLLKPFARQDYNLFDLRVCFNGCSPAMESVAAGLISQLQQLGLRVDRYDGNEPYYKYPEMWYLFHEPPGLETRFTMWFDDDSFILPGAPRDWFHRVGTALGRHHMVGAIYGWKHWSETERDWIEDQPWYSGKSVRKPHVPHFCTGGWWGIRTSVLHAWEWPSKALQHEGGDVMLGELCRQQGYKLGKFTDHIGINADDAGRCSKAPRRGASGKTKRVGVGYERPKDKNWTDILTGDR